MNFPRLTIEFTAGSEADHRNAGWVRILARVCGGGNVRDEEPWAVPVNGGPYSVASRRFTNVFCDVSRSVTLPPLVNRTSVTNCCADVRRSPTRTVWS